MDPAQIPGFSPSRLAQRSAPNSPIRHIHSSFPYYFYSTPSTPNSEGGLSAFVALCESRLHEPCPKTASSDSISNAGNPEFRFKSFKCPPVAHATAGDHFHNGKFHPSEPLKLPPRLQYIANVRKSLRSTQSFRHRRPTELNTTEDSDPFAVAIQTVTKEDAPWCQVSKHHHRRAKSYEHMWTELDPIWEVRDTNKGQGSEGEYSFKKKRSRILSYFNRGSNESHGPAKLDPILEGSNTGKSTASSCEKKVGKKRRIVEYIWRATKGKERTTQDEACSKRVVKHDSGGVRTLAGYKQSYKQLNVLACLGL